MRTISIHAPRTGSDIQPKPKIDGDFLISIHAPRTGSDNWSWNNRSAINDFNPRSPHGERHNVERKETSQTNFNPRSPHGERRLSRRMALFTVIFQSTLPARGATPLSFPATNTNVHFNPRSPHGERRVKFRFNLTHIYFNPRSPHGERQECYNSIQILP